MAGLVLLIAGMWIAWYALVRFRQRLIYSKALNRAMARGLPVQDPPPPPDALRFWLRVNGPAALIGLAGGLIAVLVLVFASCGHR